MAPPLRYMADTCVGRFLMFSVLLISISDKGGLIRIVSSQFRNPGLGIIHRQESVMEQEMWDLGSK